MSERLEDLLSIARKVAAIPLLQDWRPDDVDILCIPGVPFAAAEKIGITPDDVRKARAAIGQGGEG